MLIKIEFLQGAYLDLGTRSIRVETYTELIHIDDIKAIKPGYYSEPQYTYNEKEERIPLDEDIEIRDGLFRYSFGTISTTRDVYRIERFSDERKGGWSMSNPPVIINTLDDILDQMKAARNDK